MTGKKIPKNVSYSWALPGSDFVSVAYTEREDRVRLMSARRMTKNEQEYYFEQNSQAGDVLRN